MTIDYFHHALGVSISQVLSPWQVYIIFEKMDFLNSLTNPPKPIMDLASNRSSVNVECIE